MTRAAAASPPPVGALFLTLQEVADRWRTSKKAVRAAIDRGELRATRFNRKVVRVRLDELERYEARSTGAELRDRHRTKGEPDGGLSG